MVWLFIIGFLIYSTLAVVSYDNSFKLNNWYFPAGLILALAANAIWLQIARNQTDSSKLVIIGLYWDIMLTFAYILIPILIFNAKLSLTQWSGIVMIIIGIIFTKVTKG